MKHFFIFLIILFVGLTALRAQDSSKYTDNNIMLHAEAGYTNFHAWKLNDLFIAGGGQRFPAITAVGLGALISEDQDGFRYEWNCAFHYFLPFSNAAVFEGQTIKTRLHGWEFLTCKDGIDVVKAKCIDVSGGLGFYCGNLKLDWGAQKYTNPFIAPMAKIDLRVNFWKISIGGRISGRYDLTFGNWKRKSSGMTELPEYKFREMQGMIYIGWIFHSQ